LKFCVGDVIEISRGVGVVMKSKTMHDDEVKESAAQTRPACVPAGTVLATPQVTALLSMLQDFLYGANPPLGFALHVIALPLAEQNAPGLNGAPRVTLTVALEVSPEAFPQVTVRSLAPTASGRIEPLGKLHVASIGETLYETGTLLSIVIRLLDGLVIVTTGAAVFGISNSYDEQLLASAGSLKQSSNVWAPGGMLVWTAGEMQGSVT
jgi:hypothetical protein